MWAGGGRAGRGEAGDGTVWTSRGRIEWFDQVKFVEGFDEINRESFMMTDRRESSQKQTRYKYA